MQAGYADHAYVCHFPLSQGKARSILVECGQHGARETVEVAKRIIRRLVLGPEAKRAAQPHTLRTEGSVYVGRGFRWRGDVTAFQLVKQGEVIAEVITSAVSRCRWPSLDRNGIRMLSLYVSMQRQCVDQPHQPRLPGPCALFNTG